MISDSALSTELFSTIRTLLLSPPIYITNSQTQATSQVSVEATYDNKKAIRPVIVIYPIASTKTKNKFIGITDVSGISTGKSFINVFIDIYAGNTGHIDEINNQLLDRIDNHNFNGVELIALASDYAFVNPNDAKYHKRNISLSFDKE